MGIGALCTLLTVGLASLIASADAQPSIITNVAIPWEGIAMDSKLNQIYVFGGENWSPETVVLDGTTFAQSTVGTGWGGSVDSGKSNYWSATVYTGTVIARSGTTHSALAEVSLGYCPMMTSCDAVNRRVWVGAQCGGDMVYAIDADNYSILAGPLNTGGTMSSVIANPATGRAYVFTSAGSTRVKPPTYSLTANAFDRVVAVNETTNLLYVVSNSGEFQIRNGAADPETLLVSFTPPFSVGDRSVAVNPLLNRLYLANGSSNNIAVLDAVSGQPLGNISLGPQVTNVRWITVDPPRNRIMATALVAGSPRLFVIQDCFVLGLSMHAGITIFGPPGQYQVESAATPTGGTWSPRATITLTNGPCIYVDLDACISSGRFYRALRLP
jgi:DNA-binding beta-propeller fold protein YncE